MPTTTSEERLDSVFRHGCIRILVALLRHDPLPLSSFQPEPWPALPVPFPPTRTPPLSHAC